MKSNSCFKKTLLSSTKCLALVAHFSLLLTAQIEEPLLEGKQSLNVAILQFMWQNQSSWCLNVLVWREKVT